jgi:hypothetical protein
MTPVARPEEARQGHALDGGAAPAGSATGFCSVLADHGQVVTQGGGYLRGPGVIVQAARQVGAGVAVAERPPSRGATDAALGDLSPVADEAQRPGDPRAEDLVVVGDLGGEEFGVQLRSQQAAYRTVLACT